MSLVANQLPKMMMAKPDEITMRLVSLCGWQMKHQGGRETNEPIHAAVENLSHVKHLYTTVLLNPKTLLFLHGGMD